MDKNNLSEELRYVKWLFAMEEHLRKKYTQGHPQNAEWKKSDKLDRMFWAFLLCCGFCEMAAFMVLIIKIALK